MHPYGQTHPLSNLYIPTIDYNFHRDPSRIRRARTPTACSVPLTGSLAMHPSVETYNPEPLPERPSSYCGVGSVPFTRSCFDCPHKAVKISIRILRVHKSTQSCEEHCDHTTYRGLCLRESTQQRVKDSVQVYHKAAWEGTPRTGDEVGKYLSCPRCKHRKVNSASYPARHRGIPTRVFLEALRSTHPGATIHLVLPRRQGITHSIFY